MRACVGTIRSPFPAIAWRDAVYVADGLFGSSTFRRRAGEALHPERESLETLFAIRQNIGDYNWHGQYQQDPTPVGGAMVKVDWLRYYEPADRPQQFSRIVQSWDTANKASELSDYSVCTIWGVADRMFYLLDVYRERLNYPDLRRKAVELARHHNASNIVIEDRASGTQLIQDLQAEGVFGVVPYDPPAGADKVVRLHMQTTMFESGFVLLPRVAAWLADYVFEVTTFPGTKYEDQVDSTTRALAYLRGADSLEVWARLARASAFDRLLGI